MGNAKSRSGHSVFTSKAEAKWSILRHAQGDGLSVGSYAHPVVLPRRKSHFHTFLTPVSLIFLLARHSSTLVGGDIAPYVAGRLGQIELVLTMIISPALAALALSSSTARIPSLKDTESICYDSRHVTYHPSLDDCAAIINHQIAVAPLIGQEITFSRSPTHSQFRLPYYWTTTKNECIVTIDIPPFPGQPVAAQSEQASMTEIKRAALSVLMACVVRGNHLGGFVTAGRMQRLVVSIAGGERAKGGEIE